jgi:hypothetical protein
MMQRSNEFGKSLGNRLWGNGAKRRDVKRRRRGRTLLGFEGLESRRLLTIAVIVSGSTAKFTGSSSDNLYLKTDTNDDLEYSTDGTDYNNLSSSPFNLKTQSSTVQVYVGGTLYLEGLHTGGTSLSIDGPSAQAASSLPKAKVSIPGTIDTQGGNLTIQDFSSIEVGTSTAGATVSTRNLGQATNYATGTSNGSSGALTLSVENPDPFNPILNVGFNYPEITVDAGSALYAQAGGGFAAGDVTLSATNTNYTLDGLSFPTLQADVRSSAITLADAGAGQGVVVEWARSTSTRSRATSRSSRTSSPINRPRPNRIPATRSTPGASGSAAPSMPESAWSAHCRA